MKSLLLLAALVSAAVLAGCGSGDEKANATAAATHSRRVRKPDKNLSPDQAALMDSLTASQGIKANR